MEDPAGGTDFARTVSVMGRSRRNSDVCAIEVSEDEFIIEPGLSWHKRARLILFKLLFKWSVPSVPVYGFDRRYRGGLIKSGGAGAFWAPGVRIETPEFPLVSRNDRIDPDTLRPDERRFIKI